MVPLLRSAGLPSEVRHFSLVHLDSLDWALVLLPVYPPPAFSYFWATSWALRADHWPGLPPCEPALTWLRIRWRSSGLV